MKDTDTEAARLESFALTNEANDKENSDTEAARHESFALTNEANDNERYRHRGGPP